MSIWTWIIILGIGFLLLNTLKNKGQSLLSNLPIIGDQISSNGNQTDQNSNLPEPIEKGKQYLEKDYTIPLWAIVLLIIILAWIFKK